MSGRVPNGRESEQPVAGRDPQPSLSAAQVVAEAMAAYRRGDLDALATLVHPEAEIEMLLLGGEPARGPEGLHDALAAAREGIHRPTGSRLEAVADDAAMMIGRIQNMDARGAISDRTAVWLTVLRDGKLWRTRVLTAETDVPASYEELTGRPPGRTPR